VKITLANSAGFCFGVKRAVRLAEEAANEPTHCVMLGPVIHNDLLIERLESRGLRCVHSPEEIPSGTSVIIRSHGEKKEIWDALSQKGCTVLDATCPKVSKIHAIVEKASLKGRQVVIIGQPDHPEVMAIAGWCQEAFVFSNLQELESWLEKTEAARERPITVVSQTPCHNPFGFPVREKPKKECTNCEIFDTICEATCKRQSEVTWLAVAMRCNAYYRRPKELQHKPSC